MQVCSTLSVGARGHSYFALTILIEPTLLGILLPEDRDPVVAALRAVIAKAEAEGPESGMRAVMETAAGEAWSKLDAETQAKRLQALASCMPLIGPHHLGLCELAVTEADVVGLRPPTLLFYGEESFPFEPAIASRIHTLRPDLRLITAEKATHNVHRDRSDLVNAESLAFLGS